LVVWFFVLLQISRSAQQFWASQDFNPSIFEEEILELQTTATERGDVKNLISIGKFSKLTDLSVRTLRLYDELDVLKPAFIDPDTGYRSYRLDQVGSAHRIRAMRQLEMPLHAIRVVMGEPDRARDYLERHRGELRGKLETMQSKLDLLDRAISAHA
jgi:DNA-binding transcriptional MerR regulator